MAGLGVLPGQIDYRTLCGLYYSREEIASKQRKQFESAIIAALSRVEE